MAKKRSNVIAKRANIQEYVKRMLQKIEAVMDRSITDWEQLTEEQLERLMDIFSKALAGKITDMFEVEFRAGERTKWMEVMSSPISREEGNDWYQVIAHEITQRKNAFNIIAQRLEFEKILSKISSRFISSTDLDNSINQSLKDLAVLGNASRAYVFLFKEDGKSVSLLKKIWDRRV